MKPNGREREREKKRVMSKLFLPDHFLAAPPTECQKKPVAAGEDERVPALVLVVQDRVDTVAQSEWEHCRAEVFERHAIKFFGAALGIGALVFELYAGKDP